MALSVARALLELSDAGPAPPAPLVPVVFLALVGEWPEDFGAAPPANVRDARSTSRGSC